MVDKIRDRLGYITLLFMRARDLAKLDKKGEIRPRLDGNSVVVEIVVKDERMRFAVGDKGQIAGPGPAIGLGSIDDDGIAERLANAIKAELEKRVQEK